MSRTRKLIIAFWIFIVIMLLWQFYTYNQGLKQAAIDHPQQEHFWFTNAVVTPATPAASSQAHHDGADVVQTNFVVENNTPNPGSITCLVTLKNLGNAKAMGVQIMVRPYRGTSNWDEDAGHQNVVVLSDDDPLSKFGDWVTFPDLAPGESSTQSVVFLGRSLVTPGKNPNPDIMFQTEKAVTKPSSQGNGD
jgi:hypothetical protein